MRKGQVTIFVILGIVMIISIGLLLRMYNESLPKPEITTENNKQPLIKLFVENCLERTTKDGLKTMGYQNQNNPGFDRNQIEEYLKNHVQNNLKDCIQNFSTFVDKGFIISHKQYTTVVFVRDKSILIQLNYPLIIIENNQETKMSSFVSEIPFDYQGRSNTINNILRILAPIILNNLLSQQTSISTTNNPSNNQLTGLSNVISPSNDLSISKLAEMAYEQGFTYDLIYDENGEIRLFLKFEASGTNPAFTHMITIPQEPFVEEETFFLHEIPTIQYPTTWKIETSSQGIVTYEENSEYVTISQDGTMTISGNIAVGTTRVLIKATDERGNTDYAYANIKRQ